MSALKMRFAFSAFFLVLLLLLACLSRAVFAQEESVGTDDDRAKAIERALGTLRNVVGLDVDAYNWSIRAYGKDLFMLVLPHEFIGFDFWTDESQLTAYVEFVDGMLQSIDMFVQKGVPLMVQMVHEATNEVEMAKGFLSRYQAYCRATHVEVFKTVLDNIELKTNISKVYGNFKFEAEYTKLVDVESRTIDGATFRWIYTFNGIEAFDKWVGLAFENGYFSSFIDNWNFYKIGSYDMNVDEKKAIDIAVNAARNWSTKVYMGKDAEGKEIWIEVKGFKVVGAKVLGLMFGNSLWDNEVRGDALTLYPVWTIEVFFDDVYAGGVYGIYINIWADTGEVWRIFPLTGPLGPPSDIVPIENGESEGQAGGEEQEPTTPDDTSNSRTWLNITQIALIAIPITAGIALATVKVYSKRRKPIGDNVACQN
ncbi:MAG: hypothetical protein QW146_03890 [Candidatus Bathyarchaeia archaeon]